MDFDFPLFWGISVNLSSNERKQRKFSKLNGNYDEIWAFLVRKTKRNVALSTNVKRARAIRLHVRI